MSRQWHDLFHDIYFHDIIIKVTLEVIGWVIRATGSTCVVGVAKGMKVLLLQFSNFRAASSTFSSTPECLCFQPKPNLLPHLFFFYSVYDTTGLSSRRLKFDSCVKYYSLKPLNNIKSNYYYL